MPRLFTGVEIPSRIGEDLALKRGGLDGARWIDPENYHITIRFIGDVDNALAREVTDALDRISRGPPFSVTLGNLAVFGGRRPRALYASVRANDTLARMHVAQERALRTIGLAAETRKFIPHVTLARLRDTSPRAAAQYLSLRGHVEPLEFQVGRLVLFSSRDSVGGGPYAIEWIYPLDA